jgi:hypothetical protein
MRQHELVLFCNRGQCLCRNPNIGPLNIMGHWLASFQQGIAS